MVQRIDTVKNSPGNDLLTRWAPETGRADQVVVDKLIESASEQLIKNETASSNAAAQVAMQKSVESLSAQASATQSSQVSQTPQGAISATSVQIKAIHQQVKPRKQMEEVMGMAAAKIAKDIDANCVISIERKGMEVDDRDHLNVQVSIFKKLDGGAAEGTKFEKVEYLTKMRKVMSGSVVPIKELLMEAISHRYINKGDRIVCVEDESVGMGYKGLLFIFDVDKIFFNISNLNITSCAGPEVIEAVINIALELNKEGREGRKVGTAFIIGNLDELKPYINQMILNPFQAYPESQRKITDLNMKETVKNFAMLDGVFVIDPTGTITNGGAYINVDASVVDLPGYGTRHKNSAAITKVTDSIAIVVSESGGVISVFKSGKLVMKLP